MVCEPEGRSKPYRAKHELQIELSVCGRYVEFQASGFKRIFYDMQSTSRKPVSVAVLYQRFSNLKNF